MGLAAFPIMKSVSIPAFVLLLVHGVAIASLAQSAPPPEITFHSSSDLVLVDVIALKNGLPDMTLQRDDFEIFDNGHRVAIKTFDSGAQTRPLAVWFVVQCKMDGWEKQGSALFAGQTSLLKPGLKDLTAYDTVAVAHWCDNGDAKLDLLPTGNIEDVTAVLERALASENGGKFHDRTGELALQNTLQLIVDHTHSLPNKPVPVVIFLYGDYSGMPRKEADHFIDELLETSAMAFGLKDSRSPGMWWLPGEQKEVAHYIATETGGRYLKVTPETYAAGLEEILRQLHFRYELGFKPEALDGKRHALNVKLADAAKNKHKGVRLRSRPDYVPSSGDTR